MSDIPVIMLAAMEMAYLGLGVLFVAVRLSRIAPQKISDAIGIVLLCLVCVIIWPVLCLAGANGKDQGE